MAVVTELSAVGVINEGPRVGIETEGMVEMEVVGRHEARGFEMIIAVFVAVRVETVMDETGGMATVVVFVVIVVNMVVVVNMVIVVNMVFPLAAGMNEETLE